jgi:hypothetical protein
MYKLRKIFIEVLKEYSENEKIIYIKNDNISYGEISKMNYNDGINPDIIIKVDGEEISTRIDNVFLKKNPYLNLTIRQFQLLLKKFN